MLDSNVLIDVIESDAVWADWSLEQIARGAERSELAYNQIVIAEVGPRFGSVEGFRAFNRNLGIDFVALDEPASMQAGKAFIAYRKNRGPSAARIPLPDFFIGGHAQATGAAILTRDPRFYRSYFPQVELITPETQP